MKKSSLVFLGAAMLAACNGGEAPHESARSILVPGPGAYGYDVASDGRVAYSTFINGKAAIFVANADGKNAKRVSFGVWDSNPTWSHDGKWIVFNRDVGGQSDAILVPADSGAERAVAATASSETALDWLADDSGVVYRVTNGGRNEAWVYRVADGSRSRLFETDASVDATPSPDGKLFAYTNVKDGVSTVWLWDAEKKAHRQLTTDGFESVSFRAFSPDGRSIVYVSRRTGTADIWRVDVATGAKTQMTQDVGDDYSPQWSPDGKRIAFISTRGGQTDLWVLTNGDADAKRVTDDALAEGFPLWTNTGDAVVATVPLGQPHLYSIPIAGGAPSALTSGDWGVNGSGISRDKTQIWYSGNKNGDGDLWVVSVNGGASRLVSGGPGFDGDASWSPDGHELAFTSFRSGNADIWIVPAAGGTARRVTDWPSAETAPAWSPDGKTIVFTSSHESGSTDLWAVAPAGGTPRRLTKSGGIAEDSRWSPDSRSITFSANFAGNAVYTISPSGGAPHQVFPPTSFGPTWLPDGRSIAAAMCKEGYCRIEIRGADGSAPHDISPSGDVYEFFTRFNEKGDQALVNYQDLRGDGGNRIGLRPTAGGAEKEIGRPAGHSVNLVGFAHGDSAVIAVGSPLGTALQRIPVPKQAAAK